MHVSPNGFRIGIRSCNLGGSSKAVYTECIVYVGARCCHACCVCAHVLTACVRDPMRRGRQRLNANLRDPVVGVGAYGTGVGLFLLPFPGAVPLGVSWRTSEGLYTFITHMRRVGWGQGTRRLVYFA